MRRRDFLMSIMATTGLSVLPARLRATRLRSIGVQLFSVREELQKDPDRVLKRLAMIGFREVEVWLPPMSDLDIPTLRMLLDRHGLKATSRHWSNFTPEGLDGMLRESKILGNRYLIVTTLPADQRGKLDSYKRASEWFNSIGRSAHDRGIQFGFHTERWDFPALDGVVPFDYLLKNTDSSLVRFEIDVGHVVRVGRDPVDYLQRYPHRFVALHLKDVRGTELVPAGTGTIDFRRVLRSAESARIEHYFVEDEWPGPEIEHVAADFKYFNGVNY